jgi:hypothetical protein
MPEVRILKVRPTRLLPVRSKLGAVAVSGLLQGHESRDQAVIGRLLVNGDMVTMALIRA